MKVFNGIYYSNSDSIVIKIFYDGKAWNFKSRDWLDTTKRMDFIVKEGETIQGESSLADFLEISRLEQEAQDMKPSEWKFIVDLQSNDDKHPYLSEEYDEVKSLGTITFYGVGQGDFTVCGRFQVDVINTPDEPEEWTYLHREVTGSVNNSELYLKIGGYCLL